jgi:hypothetical protein
MKNEETTFSELSQRFSSHYAAVGRMTTRSVLSPLLWLVGITATITTPGIIFTDGYVQAGLLATLILCVFSAIGFYAYFAFTEPNRLQSEEYQIERTRLDTQMIGDDRGYAAPQTLDGALVPNQNVKSNLVEGR